MTASLLQLTREIGSPFDTDLLQIYHPRAMGQRPVALAPAIFSTLSPHGAGTCRPDAKRRSALPLLFLAVLIGLTGCDRRTATPAWRPTTVATSSSYVTVASLVPAATDLICGMSAADHLVAVSNWDADRPEIAKLP